MKITKFRYFLIFFAISYSCFGQKLIVLPLEDAFKRQESITTKEFIESFTYIPLETTQQCLIGINPKIYLTDEYIIITDQQKQCFLFDRVSGKFIRQIGHYGRDPGGYQNTRGFFNKSTSTLYFLGWESDLMKYSLDGKVLGSIPIPHFNDSFTNSYLPENYDYLDNNLIACNILNTNGIQETLIMIFDEKGNEIKTVPNKNITKEHKFSLSTGELNFFHYNEKLLYNKIYNDTIFILQLDKPIPYLVLNRGKYRITRESRRTAVEKISPKVYFESEKFISFDFWGIKNKRYFALFNKSTLKLKVCEFSVGIKNDTDGFIPFLPKAIFKEELVGLIQAIDLVDWVENNKEIKETLPPKFNKHCSIVPTDNPIIVIASLKK